MTSFFSAENLQRNAFYSKTYHSFETLSSNKLKHICRIIVFLGLWMLAGLFSNATVKLSIASGNWSAASTWSPSGEPANGDDVIVSAGHTVIINVTTNNISSLLVNGSLTIGNNSTNRTVTISGTVTVSSGAVFNTAGNGGN